MDEQNLKWIKEPNFYFKRKREVIESLIIGRTINIGCGSHKIKHATNVDLPKFDATKYSNWGKVSGKYDTIILSDVIEHIEKEDVWASAICAARKRVIITVPAYKWLFSNYDNLLGHYRRYNKIDFFPWTTEVEDDDGDLLYTLNWNFKYLFGALLPLFFIRKYTSGKTPLLPKWVDVILYYLSKITLPFGSTLLIVIDKESTQ